MTQPDPKVDLTFQVDSHA